MVRGDVRTTKGLRPTDSLSKARRLYPGLRYNTFVPNMYDSQGGHSVYSVRSGSGWLDIYKPVRGARYDRAFFVVRHTSVSKPPMIFADGC